MTTTIPTPEVRTALMRDVVRTVMAELEGVPHAKQAEMVWELRAVFDDPDSTATDAASTLADRLRQLAPRLTNHDMSAAIAGCAYQIENPDEDTTNDRT